MESDSDNEEFFDAVIYQQEPAAMVEPYQFEPRAGSRSGVADVSASASEPGVSDQPDVVAGAGDPSDSGSESESESETEEGTEPDWNNTDLSWLVIKFT